MGKRKGNRRETAFRALDPATIERRAKDKRLPPKLRRKYVAEAKARKRRNKQKRSK